MSDDAQDFLGNAVSPARAATLAGVDAFVRGYLTYGTETIGVLQAASDDPGHRLANIYAGLLYMLFESEAGESLARKALAAARAAQPGNVREERLLDFLAAWVADDVPAALAVTDDIVRRWPNDLVAVKLHQYLAFNRGDFPDMLRIALAALEANRNVAQMHGMLAFAYEQCHLLDEAEQAARQALALYDAEPWAQHSLAHVMLTRGRIDEGAAFMSAASPGWAQLNSFIYTHNWWHLALFALSQGRLGEVLAIYDRHCWGRDPDYSQDQVGAVSLLARMEFAGIDVGGRWDDVADRLTGREQDVAQPFLTLQYLYGLARAGRPQAAGLMQAIRAKAAAAPAHSREAWTQVALPAAEGIVAFHAGDFALAARRMGQALPRMAEVGGSHAQRDLFEQIELAALLGDRRFARAQQILESRRGYDPEGAPLNLVLAKVYDALGLPDQSREAASRAERTRMRHAPERPIA